MKRFVFFFLLLALIPSVSAELLAFGEPALAGTPCDAFNDSVQLQNQGESAASYSVSVDGSASDFVRFSAISFTLQPGQVAPLDVFYTIPCDTLPGTYTLNIYFTGETEELVLQQQIIVSIPDNINLSIQPLSQVIAPCETATYNLTLSNPLSFNELYTLRAQGHPNAHLSHQQAILRGGETQEMTFSVTPDDCTQSGSFPLSLVIESDKASQQEEYMLELLITSTNIAELAPGVTNIRTDYTDSSAELPIRNLGDQKTTYTLSAQGAPWATINPSTLTLKPGEAQNVLLRLAPDESIPQGNYPITFMATVDTSGIVYGKDLAVKLGPPTLLETNPALFVGIILGIIIALIGAFFLIRYVRSPAFSKLRANMAKKRAQRREARRKAKLARQEARRKAKEAKQRAKEARIAKKVEAKRKALERKQKAQERAEKKLERKVAKEIKKSHYLIPRKDVTRGMSKKQTLRLSALILIVLVLLLAFSAWSLIAPNLPYVGIGIAVLGIIFVARALARQTVASRTWRLLLAKHTVPFKIWRSGLRAIHITSENPIKGLKVLARKTKPTISPSPAVYQTFSVQSNADVSLDAQLSISKRWLAKHNVTAEDVKLIKYTKNKWTSVPLAHTGSDHRQDHFSADLKQGTYSLYIKPVPKPETAKKKKIARGVAGVVFLVVLSLFFIPLPEDPTQGIPPQTWDKNTVHALDLSAYFVDPDGDSLTFSATETEHITIDIRGGVAYLTPETNWIGEERVRFIASDGSDEITSNIVALRVQNNLIPLAWNPYIAIVLALLAILILVWIVRELQDKR